eukprot:GDKH01023925.1.p1 GENE.GDKH01023925.1~~GDKH01023925.1.p1  ORF type:complete len:1573 (-),score=396.29 GDKH01023925.1:13091-17809(-)
MISREKSRGRSILGDLTLALLLFLLLFAAGYGHLRALRTDRSAVTSIERLYGPSVMLALGRGFIEPNLYEYPELRAFLRGEIESLPPEAVPEVVLENPSPVAAYHRYLVYTVALFWRIFGISWTSLEPLLALLFAWAGVALYGTMRLGMGKTFALAATLGVMISPAMLGTLTELRDFSKAPFILSMVMGLGWLLKYKAGFRQLLLWAVGLGLIAGVGMGFRQDVFVFIPLSLALLCVSAFRADVRSRRWVRLVAAPVCLACFYAAAWPMMGRMEGGAHPGHHLVQGFSNKRLDNLGILPAAYRPVASGLDQYIFSMLYDYMQRLGGDKAGHFTMDTSGSDQAGKQWIREMARRFPADLAARGIAAVLRTLRYADAYAPTFFEPTVWHKKVYAVHHKAASHFHRFGLFYGLAAMLILAGYQPILALGVFLFVLYMLGYIALQCEYRHAFHLAFVPFWIGGFLLEQSVAAVRSVYKQGFPETRRWKRAAVRVSSVAGCGLALLLPPLFMLRFYQVRQVLPLLEAGMGAERKSIPVTEQSSHGWTLFAVDDPGYKTPRSDVEALCRIVATLLSPELKMWHARGRFMAAEFKAGAGVEWLIHKYDTVIPLNDFSQLVRLPHVAGRGDVIRYYFPVYELLKPDFENGFLLCRNHFQGIAVPEDKADAFLGLYEVKIPEEMSLLMQFVSVDDRSPETLYQRVGFFPNPMFYYQSEKNATENINLAEAARRFGQPGEDLFFLRAQFVLSRKPETRLFIANRFLEDGALEDALEAAEDIGDTMGQFVVNQVNLLEMIGRQFHIRKEPVPAEEAFAHAWALAPQRENPLRLELAVLYESKAVPDKALAHYRSVLLNEPDNETGVMNADLLLTQHVAPERRIAFWEEITEAHPVALQPWLRLGAAWESAGNTASAAEAYATAFRCHPEDAESAIRSATASLSITAPEQLRELLDRSLKTSPELRPLAVSCLVNAGNRMIQDGQAEQALTLFSLAAGYAPDDEWILLLLARALAATGNAAEAGARFEALLPGHYGKDAAFGLDQLLRDSNEDRLAYWQALEARNPGNEHVVFFLKQAQDNEGRLLFESGRYADAVRVLEHSCGLPCSIPEQSLLLHLAGLAATGVPGDAAPVRELLQSGAVPASQAFFWMQSAVGQLLAAGHKERALIMARTAVAVAPDVEANWLALIQAHQQFGEDDAVRKVCQEALAASVHSEPIARILEDVLIRLNSGENRINEWRQIREKQPDNPIVLRHLGYACEENGVWQEAAEAYAALIEQGQDSAELRIRLGSVLVRAGDLDRGMNMLQDGEARHAGGEAVPAQVLQNAGSALLAASQPAAAERLFRLAARNDPEELYIPLRIGDALLQQGRQEEALETWKQVVLSGTETPAATQAARMLDLRLASGQRLDYWRSLAKQAADSPLVNAYYALAFARAGDVEQARHVSDSMMERHPHHPDTVLCGGLIACLSGDPDTGVARIRAVVKEHPESAGSAAAHLDEIALMLMEKDQLAQSESLLKEASALEPENLLYCMHLGEVLLKLERIEEAIEKFERILTAVPDSPRTAALLEEALRRKQDLEGRSR